MSEIRVGSYVRHARRPGWGLGKVFGRSAQHVLVGFRNVPESERFKRLEWRDGLLEPADVETDPVLDSWVVECDSTCHYIPPAARRSRKKAGTAPAAATWTLEKVWDRFTQKFHGGLNDEYYLDGERKWRVAQHTVWTEAMAACGRRQATKMSEGPEAGPASADEMGRLVVTILESSRRPLLHPRTELPALKDALATPAGARTFVDALVELIDAPALTASAYNAYLRALKSLPRSQSGSLVRWAIVSAMPSIAQPDRHLFVKPASLQRAAALLAFDLHYTPTPQWPCYQRMLAFGSMVLDFLGPLGGRDFIDVQAVLAVLED